MKDEIGHQFGGIIVVKAKKLAALAASLFLVSYGSFAISADLQWEGEYRVEGNWFKNYTLSASQGVVDSYLIHHLIMEPKIVAADGFNINARFDAFNSGLNDDQHGQVFGDYQYQGTTNAQAPSVLTHTETQETIVVSELYLNWVNEFGALVAGRVPLNFGLGMYYNAGGGLFDHSLQTIDLVGYKLVLGNITIFPAYGIVREGSLLQTNDTDDYMVIAEYNNPETDLSMGFLFDQRVAPMGTSSPNNGNDGNDFPTSYFNNASSIFSNATVTGGFSAYHMNAYIKKKWDTFNLGLEVGFVNGSTGVSVADSTSTTGPDSVGLNGIGAAAEVGYKTGRIKLNLRAGYASGDDPDTARIESYSFSPNYQVAMMMFRYPMGQYDVLRSSLYGTHPAVGAAAGSVQGNLGGLDTEAITDAMYFAPNLVWSLSDHYDFLGTLCYATTVKPAISGAHLPLGYTSAPGNNLGFETDLGFSYHPIDKFTWMTTLGVFFPGNAWAGPTFSVNGTPTNFDTSVSYGATTKAAISF